jgi:hypothetical protein
LLVTSDRTQAWIDSEKVIDAYVANREIGLRPGEIKLSRPFGIASGPGIRIRSQDRFILRPSLAIFIRVVTPCRWVPDAK